MSKPTVLLVSPTFHGYWSAIAAALDVCGYDVTVHRYDQTSTAGERIGNKLLHELPPTLTGSISRAQSRRAVDALASTLPDRVLIVKGDSLDGHWWDALQHSRIPATVWFYDELDNMNYSLDALRNLTGVASYSNADVVELSNQGIPALHVPLGFDSLSPFSPHREHILSFIGARYPTREAMLREVVSHGVPLRAFGRSWSRHPWDILRTRAFRGASIPSARDLARASYYGVMAGSVATLNLHGKQAGFNMRTFEAPGVGALQFIDRSDVESYYDIGTEVIVTHSAEEIAENFKRAETDTAWAEKIRQAGQRRTLAEHTLVHRIRLLETLWD
jgi:spore maturation protein CgeB